MSSCLCDQCAALCCRYISLPIDNPTTRRDYDNIRWYLIHQNIVVYIEKKQWYVGVLNRCKHLQDDNLCGIYETRPAICRKYTTDNCDYHGGEYDFEQLFTSAEHLMAYAETALEVARAKRSRARGRSKPAASAGTPVKPRRGAVVASLPIVGGNGSGTDVGSRVARGEGRRRVAAVAVTPGAEQSAPPAGRSGGRTGGAVPLTINGRLPATAGRGANGSTRGG